MTAHVICLTPSPTLPDVVVGGVPLFGGAPMPDDPDPRVRMMADGSPPERGDNIALGWWRLVLHGSFRRNETI